MKRILHTLFYSGNLIKYYGGWPVEFSMEIWEKPLHISRVNCFIWLTYYIIKEWDIIYRDVVNAKAIISTKIAIISEHIQLL